MRPSATEEPFWTADKLIRSDVRPDTKSGKVSAGLPLALSIQVPSYAASGCTNLSGTMVDIWQCDAQGNYSGENGDTGDFLRGGQLTGAGGRANFITAAPYDMRGSQTTRNVSDGISSNTGDTMLLDLTGDARKGYAGTLVVGLSV